MSRSSNLSTISEFTNLSSGERLSYLKSILCVCSHGELVSVQSVLTDLFYRDFIQLPLDVVVTILKLLTLQDIKACMLVKKSWYDVIHCGACSLVWRRHCVRLSPVYSACLVDSMQWKRVCKLIITFQSRLVQPVAYETKPLVQYNDEIGKMVVFTLFHNDNYLVVHGHRNECPEIGDLSGSYSKECIFIWKIEGDELVFKKNVLEGRECLNSNGTSSDLKVCFHDMFIMIAHIYLDIFDINNSDFSYRIRLPSMSGIMHYDFLTKDDGSLYILALIFSDFSIFVLEPTKGEILKSLSIEEGRMFHFSLLPKPKLSLLILSGLELKELDLTSGESFQTVISLQHHFINGFKLSKDKEMAAVFCEKLKTSSQLHTLYIIYIYTTSNWQKIKEINTNPTINIYSLNGVGQKYIILSCNKRRLQLIIYDLQQSELGKRNVLFDDISALRDTFQCHSLVVLSDTWLDGVVDDVTSIRRKERAMPLFVVLTGNTLNSIITLCLHV